MENTTVGKTSWIRSFFDIFNPKYKNEVFPLRTDDFGLMRPHIPRAYEINNCTYARKNYSKCLRGMGETQPNFGGPKTLTNCYNCPFHPDNNVKKPKSHQ